MGVKVRFRFNKISGEVEVFEVDQDSDLPIAEHEREHDRVAAELGAWLDRHPQVTELTGRGGALPATRREDRPAEDEAEAPRTDRAPRESES